MTKRHGLGIRRRDGRGRAGLIGALAALALALQLPFPPAAEAAAGGWKPTADLQVGRSSAAAATVGGKVLVVGGQSGQTILSSAELYRPDSRSWMMVESLATARHRHTATPLADGRVLVVGGRNSSGPLGSAEVYDPATRAWSSAGTLSTGPRYWHTATLLPDGRVLVAGGLTGKNVGNPGFCFCGELISLQTAEVWDPATGLFTAVAPLSTARDSHTATLLKDGKVLVAGGYGETSAELFDPAANSWSTTGPMQVARMNHSANLLKNGTVVVAGGGQGGPCCVGSSEVFNPATGQWSFTTGEMAVSRAGQSGTVLSGPQCTVHPAPSWCQKVLVVSDVSSELFDRRSGSWTSMGALSFPRDGHITALLANGKVLVAGGYHDDSLRSAEVFSPPVG